MKNRRTRCSATGKGAGGFGKQPGKQLQEEENKEKEVVVEEEEEEEELEEEVIGPGVDLEKLERFISMNAGSWEGTFTQYDFEGGVLESVETRVVGSAVGEGAHIGLRQTLSIKQAPSKCQVQGEPADADVWVDFQMGDVNLSTVDLTQQMGFFESDGSFSFAHQTADMLLRVLRVGVLGEDDFDEEFPKGLKLPSRRPALVSESCLFSGAGDRRIRAFHVLDPRGMIDTIGVFDERRSDGNTSELRGGLEAGKSHRWLAKGALDFTLEEIRQVEEEKEARLQALLGEWTGVAEARRSKMYGATCVVNDVRIHVRREDSSILAQDVSHVMLDGAVRKMTSRAAINGSLLRFDGGLQVSLLPDGVFMACPTCVARGQAFFFELGWIELAGSPSPESGERERARAEGDDKRTAPKSRRRIVRTYDTDGMVVSTTLSAESCQ
eukprot:jgi/Mesen1/6870/ME000351S05981